MCLAQLMLHRIRSGQVGCIRTFLVVVYPMQVVVSNAPNIPVLVLFLDHRNKLGSTFNTARDRSHCCDVIDL